MVVTNPGRNGTCLLLQHWQSKRRSIAGTWIHVGWSSMKGGPLNFGNSTRMKLGNSSCGDFPLEQIISMTYPAVPLNCSNFTKHQLIVVVRRTLADLHTYNVRMRPPAVSADEVLAWIPWHSAVIFAIEKSLFAKKNCALLCSHSSACVGKANRAFFATCCFTEGLYHC